MIKAKKAKNAEKAKNARNARGEKNAKKTKFAKNAKIAENEKLRFPLHSNLGLFETIDGFFGKILIFFNFTKNAKSLQNAYQMVFLPKKQTLSVFQFLF